MQPEETDARNPESELEGSAANTAEQGESVEQVESEAADYNAIAEELESVEAAPKTDSERVLAAEKEALLAKAEMENYRKRMQREAEQQLKYANLPLVRDLLEVGDNLKRALDAAEEDGKSKGLREGVAMVSQQLTDVLAKYGCKAIPALGQEFDPNVHEAISQMASDEYESGVVMNEVAVGYLLHDRVVRPSNVVVSKGSPESE